MLFLERLHFGHVPTSILFETQASATARQEWVTGAADRGDCRRGFRHHSRGLAAQKRLPPP